MPVAEAEARLSAVSGQPAQPGPGWAVSGRIDGEPFALVERQPGTLSILGGPRLSVQRLRTAVAAVLKERP
jgi:hypothetical protein